MLLLTGATGLLGKYIALKLLKHGKRLRIVARDPQDSFLISLQKQYGENVEIFSADLLDVEAMRAAFKDGEIEAVIHSAAVVSFYKKDYPFMRRVNVEGTANVVNLCLEHKVDRLIHVSSVGALGREDFRTSGKEINEQMRWKESPLNTYYGHTKFLAEKEALRGAEEGLGVLICNPSFIIGYGGKDRSSAAIFEKIYAGLPFYPAGVNGFIWAEDVAAAIFVLLHSQLRGGERFVLAAENLPVKDVFTQVARALGKRPPFIPLTGGIGRLAGRASEFLASFSGGTPALTVESARTYGGHYRYSHAFFKSAFIGFEFTPISEAIISVAREFLAEKSKKGSVFQVITPFFY